jgi:hypothetical protein
MFLDGAIFEESRELIQHEAKGETKQRAYNE